MHHFYLKITILLFVIAAFSQLFAYEEPTTFSVGHALRAAIRFNTQYFDKPQENLQDLIAYTFFLMQRELEYSSIENSLFSAGYIDYYRKLLIFYSTNKLEAKTSNNLLTSLRSDLAQSLPVILHFFKSASQIIFIDHYYFEVIQAYQNALQESA